MNEYFLIANCKMEHQYDMCKDCKSIKEEEMTMMMTMMMDDEPIYRDGTKLILPQDNITNTCLDLFLAENGDPVSELGKIEGDQENRRNNG